MKSTDKKLAIRNRVEIRLDPETANDLAYCSKELKITKTAVIKKGIQKVKSDIKK